MHARNRLYILLGLVIITLLTWGGWFVWGRAPTNQTTPSAATEFHVGVLVPLTGRNAQYGKWILEGLELARDEINAQGGVSHRQIVLDVQNDEADPAKAISGYGYLVTVKKDQVIYGPWASSAVLAIAPFANRDKVTVLASAISPKIRDAGDYIFRMQPDAHYYLQALVPYVRAKMKVSRIGILYINNDFGIDQSLVFSKLFAEQGGTVVVNDAYKPDATDFRAELTKLKLEGVDSVFIAGYTEMAIILKQIPQVGLRNIKIIGSVPTENPDILSVAGPAAEGVVFPFHFDEYSLDPAVVSFQTRYRVRYGHPAEGFAALAFDGLHALALAARGSDFSGMEIKKGLYALSAMHGVTGTTSFDDHGDVIKPIVIKHIENSKFVRVHD